MNDGLSGTRVHSGRIECSLFMDDEQEPKVLLTLIDPRSKASVAMNIDVFGERVNQFVEMLEIANRFYAAWVETAKTYERTGDWYEDDARSNNQSDADADGGE